MASEWQRHEVKALIEDEILLIGDGYRAKNQELASSGLPFARAGNVNNGFRFEDADRFPEAHVARVGNKISQPGDVVFTSKGTVGRFAFVRPDTPRFVYSPQLCFWRSLNKDVIEPRFLYYWMQGREFFIQFKGVAGQTDMAEYVSLSDQRRMHITLPPIADQRAIAHILGTLDDKIELNRKQNETLEAMARTLFKAWFVDFEPVRAKMEGRWQRGQSLPGLPAHLYDLFPDRLVESELGEIPEGWRYGFLSDVATFQNGYAFKSKDWQESGGHPVVKIGNVKPGFIDVSGASHVSHESVIGLDRFRLNRGDLLIGMTGYVGETGLVPAIEPSAYLNQRVGRISTKQGLADLGFVYCIVRRKEYKTYAELKSRGSAQANVSSSDLMSYSCVLPTSEMLDKFNEVLNPIIGTILDNHDENQTLVQLRDTFLPKLISGELRIADAERFLKERGL